MHRIQACENFSADAGAKGRAWTTANPQADPSNPKGFRRTGRKSLQPSHNSAPVNGHPPAQTQGPKSDPGGLTPRDRVAESPPGAGSGDDAAAGGNPWEDEPGEGALNGAPAGEGSGDVDIIEDSEEEGGSE